MSARQFERDAFDWLGDCYRDGFGCSKDRDKAIENYQIAAQLGNGAAVSVRVPVLFLMC
jgi:TPR repeat protein